MKTNNDKLVIWQIIPTLGGGGAEKMVLDLSEGLQSYGYKVIVISLYNKNYATENRIRFIDQNAINVRYLNKRPGFDVHLLFKLIAMIKIEKPDIIHTHIESFKYLALASMFCKFRHVHTMHSIVGQEDYVYKNLLKYASMRKKTHFVVLSNTIGETMKSYFKTTNNYLKCIPNGIDRLVFKEKQRAFIEKSVRFIAVGSLIPVKNQVMLINAFVKMQKERKHRDFLTILGEGILRNQLEKRIRQVGLNDMISLPGNVNDVVTYLNNSDVFVMTSHFEGVSLALLEAASTGLPIITTKTGNTPEVVLDDAILIDDNDEETLCKEMIKLAENVEYRKVFADKALNLASRFDKKKMVSEYCDLYSSIQ